MANREAECLSGGVGGVTSEGAPGLGYAVVGGEEGIDIGLNS